jgi:hypothetical protein
MYQTESPKRVGDTLGKRIDEGAIQEIMRAMFYPPETKPMDTTEKERKLK